MNRIVQYLKFCDCLISLNIMSSRLIYVIAKARFPSFLRLIICHIFFSHSFADRHLGCFIACYCNNVATNMAVQVSPSDIYSSDFYSFGYPPRSGIAGSYSSFILTSSENSILFSTENIPLHISTTKDFNLSTSSPILTFCFFDNSYPNRCGVLSQCGFDLHFFNDQ